MWANSNTLAEAFLSLLTLQGGGNTIVWIPLLEPQWEANRTCLPQLHACERLGWNCHEKKMHLAGVHGARGTLQVV